MPRNLGEFTLIGVADDASAAADGTAFIIPQKCMVLEAGVLIDSTESTAATIKFDSKKQGTRGDGDVANITITGGSNYQGQVFYDEVYKGTDLAAGDMVIVQITATSSAAKTFYPYLRLRNYVEDNDNQSNKNETA